MKSRLLILLMASLALCSSCMDSYIFRLKNTSLSSASIDSEPAVIKVDLVPGEVKEVFIGRGTSSFTLIVKSQSSTKKYMFEDVDHWFGVTHDITIMISENKVEITGTRNERFEPIIEPADGRDD